MQEVGAVWINVPKVFILAEFESAAHIHVFSQGIVIGDDVVENLIAASWFPSLFRINELPFGSMFKPQYGLVNDAANAFQVDEFGHPAVLDTGNRPPVSCLPRLHVSEIAAEIRPQGRFRRIERKPLREIQPDFFEVFYSVRALPLSLPRIRQWNLDDDRNLRTRLQVNRIGDFPDGSVGSDDRAGMLDTVLKSRRGTARFSHVPMADAQQHQSPVSWPMPDA